MPSKININGSPMGGNLRDTNIVVSLDKQMQYSYVKVELGKVLESVASLLKLVMFYPVGKFESLLVNR